MIFNRLHLVSSSLGASTPDLPVIWAEGTVLDLNSMLPDGSGWILTSAYGVNDAGQIVETGLLNGAQRGFVLTPESE